MGVAAFPDCSGDAMLVLGLGVETGVDEESELSIEIEADGYGGSSIKSGITLTARIVNSKEPGRSLLYCSARVAQPAKCQKSISKSGYGTVTFDLIRLHGFGGH